MWPWAAAIAALCVLTRLPQLVSHNLMVDGDEAIVGLMGRHLAVNHEVPLFSWGQRYGLSTIEAALAAGAFAIAGLGPVALKVSMLALWTAGVVLLFFAFVNVIGMRRGAWLAAVFVLLPMWAIWSMKARGGYLTSFAASSAILWLVTRAPARRGWLTWLTAGALTGLVYLAQPLWLPGLLPIVAVALIRRRSAVCALAYAAVVAAVPLLIRTTTESSSHPRARCSAIRTCQVPSR
jgi:hypothetical protein